jgi:hypothetical protein
LEIPDFSKSETSTPFILSLRGICERIFDVMLCAYISGLKAYHQRSKTLGEKEGLKRPSFDNWDQALVSAENALATFRKAENQRGEGNVIRAESTTQEALLSLQQRYYLSSFT